MTHPRAKRRLGQHFLSDPRILGRIADALEAGPGDTVLEIGPGPGGLTAALVERGGRVVAIEKDPDLVPALRARFPGATIVQGDALEEDWHALAGGPFLAVGNIPYNITSPLVDKALQPPRPRRIVFLVYALMGALSGLGGVIWSAKFASAQSDSAVGFELSVIAATVLGGVSIAGGSGKVSGLVLGTVLLGILNNALPLIQVSPFWQLGIQGAVILAAVLTNVLVKRSNQRLALRRRAI